MNEEIKKIIEQLDERIILHSTIKEPISSDLDKVIKLSVAYEGLLEENLKLKEQYCERTDCSGRLGNSKKVEELQKENQQLKEVIDKAIEFTNKYESIKAYYEYIDEDGYDEYNYDEDFKKELLDILKEVSE